MWPQLQRFHPVLTKDVRRHCLGNVAAERFEPHKAQGAGKTLLQPQLLERSDKQASAPPALWVAKVDSYTSLSKLPSVVLTHLDEAKNVGKVWEILLEGELRPLFFSHNGNMLGPIGSEPLDFLAQKTLGKS